MTITQKLTITASFNNLAEIADFVTTTAVQAQLDDRAVYAVQMAVDEACTNIIEHAYEGRENGDIQISCKVQDDGLAVVIYDWGKAFDPSHVPELDPKIPLERRSSRGMGIFYIYKLMDVVEYKFNTSQGNQLSLFKYRKQS